MAKTLCEMKRLIKGDFDEFLEFVRDPTHACRKCGRVSNCRKRLCKPVKIKGKAGA